MKSFPLPRVGTAFVLVAVCLLLISLTASAAVRIWTDDLNRTWQGEFVRVDGPSAVFLVDGKEFSFPLARLSAPDKLVVFKLRQAAPAAAATPGSPAATAPPGPAPASLPPGTARTWTFGSAQIEPGNTVETDLPLTKEFVAAVTKAYDNKVPPSYHVRASLAVPVGFDGDKPQKVLVVSVSATGDTMSINDAKNVYTRDALAHGYMVMAADGSNGKPSGPQGDTTEYRLTLLRVALGELNARFPKAKTDWTFATAGFSGGCGYAGHQALWLSAQGYRVTGVMMLNCNYPPTQWEHDRAMIGNTSHWHQIPMFFSYGEHDTVATPAMIKEAVDTTKRGGYQRVRVEAHPGQHEEWDPHINLALEWFDSLATGAGH